MQKKLDAFDQRCLLRIFKISWQVHITNREVWERTRLQTVSDLICAKSLQLFGHIVQSKDDQDHSRVLNAGLTSPKSWS